MSGHTPAPWREIGGWIEGPNGECVVDYAGCGTHGAVWENPKDLSLALAAPDLLAACKFALDCMCETGLAQGRSELRRAIRRAEGQAERSEGGSTP